jgi:hypothetical protein
MLVYMVKANLLSQINQIKFCSSYMTFENQNFSSYLCKILFIFVQKFCKACFSELREHFPMFVNWATAGGLVTDGQDVRTLSKCD